jgi:RNA polymerase sigma factor (TIGR02999 family)
MSETGTRITQLLGELERGEPEAQSAAIEELLPLLYTELRARARQILARERPDHTLQPTALVHEAYLRLVGAEARYSTRLHFMNAAALAMRRILLDHAHARRSLKRGGGRDKLKLDALNEADLCIDMEGLDAIDLLGLDEALNELARLSPRQASVVNLKFFAGCTEPEIARMLEISEPTVRRDWATARPWLYKLIQARAAKTEDPQDHGRAKAMRPSTSCST